jgi:hypothetical protein
MPKVNSFPTEFQLVKVVDLQAYQKTIVLEKATLKSEKMLSQSQDGKSVNLLLCWAY